MRAFSERAAGALVWLPEHGVGYLPVEAAPYDQAYFDKYVAMARTPQGVAITKARVELVRAYHDGQVLDVGIGCGAFIEAHGNAVGTDINPAAVAWLAANGHAWNGGPVRAGCFWDALEHIPEPAHLLGLIERWVFVSVPLVQDISKVMSWRHYRPDEHCWYFTSDGLCRFMSWHGFECVHSNNMETALGRLDIGSFVFERRP
jgi:hypothetical protein